MVWGCESGWVGCWVRQGVGWDGVCVGFVGLWGKGEGRR